jgi:hypothetical protein
MTTFHSIALDATDELRRQMCRLGPHPMTVEEMMKCPRCAPIVRYEKAVEEEQRVPNGG